MDQVARRNSLNVGFDALLVSWFAGLSLLLAAVGLFGVVCYLAIQRTREMGIRIAVGAQRKRLRQLVLFDGLRPALFGLGLGAAVSAVITPYIRSLLYKTEPLDGTVFVAVSLVLILATTAACLVPAWRASRLDPVQALRG